MALTVLTDEQILGLLDDLTLDEAEEFLDVLRTSLHAYSTGTQSVQDGDIQQPPRTTVTSAATGATTMFVPSVGAVGVGMKVITVSPSESVDVSPSASVHQRPTGAITLFTKTGQPMGILHASTLTAFRTALASVCLLQRRESVKTVTVFGCGEQAYWHVRLALLFRGATIKHVNVISRRFSESCRLILQRFYSSPAARKAREGWADTQFSVLTPGYGEYQRLLANNLRSADVIYCCTPSTEPLFDAAILTSHEGRRKGRLIVAIGSFMRSMHELPSDLLIQATTPDRPHHHHYHKHALEGGVVVVDTLDGALKEAGEIISAGLTPLQLVELGELVMLAGIAMREDNDYDDDNDDEDIYSSSSPITSSIYANPNNGISTGTNSNGKRHSSSAEDVSSSPSVMVTSPADTALSLDKLDLGGHANAMSTVYSQDAGGSGGSRPSRPSSPSRKSSLLTMGSAHSGNSGHSGRSGRSGSSTGVTSPTGTPGVTTPTRVTTPISTTLRSSSAFRSSSTDRRRSRSLHRRSASAISLERRKKKEDHLARWLQSGNVIYKSVGLGLMDLTIGMHLIEFSRRKGVGSHIEGF